MLYTLQLAFTFIDSFMCNNALFFYVTYMVNNLLDHVYVPFIIKKNVGLDF